MESAPSEASYGVTAKALHWLIFALLVTQYAVGWLMPHIGRNTPFEGLVAWHVSIGAAILFVIVVRLAWRLVRPVPLLPAPLWERRAAYALHGLLYLTVLAMTILGWAAANYRGWTVKLFGAIPLPALAPKGTPWAHTAGDIHNTLVWFLFGFIALHVTAALYHHVIRRDRVLRRMLPVSIN